MAARRATGDVRDVGGRRLRGSIAAHDRSGADRVSPASRVALRLAQRGPAALPALRRLAVQGDWTTRALALSAAGRIVRDDASAWRRDPFRHRVATRLEWLRRRFPSAGPKGSFVSGWLIDALLRRPGLDRARGGVTWPSASAATRPWRLACARCSADPLRPVRLAAAAAMGASGSPPAESAAAIGSGADAAPERIGDTASSVEWLGRLCAAHAPVLAAWREKDAGLASLGDAATWGRFLAGETVPENTENREAEILRYAQEKDVHHNVTKPFNSVNRAQNVRLAPFLLVGAQNLRVPGRAGP